MIAVAKSPKKQSIEVNRASLIDVVVGACGAYIFCTVTQAWS